MTAVVSVSIDEGKNKEVEIPRYDPRDKSKLWISKADIHHNTMMQKIRPLVQGKLYEIVAKDDGFFNGIEDAPIEIEEVEGQPKPETEEDILLAKKAQMLTEIMNAIMELPKDEILDFLTSSSLPTGLNRRKKQPKQTQTQVEQTPPPQPDENYAYNWILDCDDAWKDLPAVVRINAMELGYNQKLWDEDAQDLPSFRTLWKDLRPNQRTAAIFLGNYTEEIWDEDAKIMMMGAKQAPHDDDESSQDESHSESHSESKEDATIATASTDMSGDRSDNDDDDDDDGMFDEFVSNFTSDKNAEETSNKAPTKDDTEDDDAMMDEFLSNFGVDEEPSNSESPKAAEEEDEMMDEFLANFATADKEKPAPPTDNRASLVDNAEGDDDDAAMDEFLSNFANNDSLKEDRSDGSDEEQPLISSPGKTSVGREFHGESSPLLATSKEAKAATETLDPEEEEPSIWDTVSSYLYWLPVVCGIPAVYMMATATGSKD